jgi:hypothetical protein
MLNLRPLDPECAIDQQLRAAADPVVLVIVADPSLVLRTVCNASSFSL